MRIIYIANSPVPSQAANSVHVMKMAQALAQLGHQVSLWTPRYNKKQEIRCDDIYAYYGVKNIFTKKNIPYFKLPKLRAISHYGFIAAYLFIYRPHVVYTRDITAAYVTAKLGVPVIFERHDIFSAAQERQVREFQYLLNSGSLLRTVVISDALRKRLIKEYHINPEKIIVAHDGADPQPKEISPVTLPSCVLNVGYTGHLYKGKGGEIIVLLARSMPDVMFHLVGGKEEDIDRLRRASNGLNNILFHGHVPPSTIPSFLSAFDVLLAPYQETVNVSGGKGDVSKWMSPLKIFEYMASGKPMIVSDLPVLREVLRNRENSLLCPPADADAWAGAIRELINHPELATKISGNALNDFNAHYSWKARAKNILSECGL